MSFIIPIPQPQQNHNANIDPQPEPPNKVFAPTDHLKKEGEAGKNGFPVHYPNQCQKELGRYFS
jgi:hypothetical protein